MDERIMCYFLYGAVNKEINEADREKIVSKSKYTFNPGTKHDIKEAVANENFSYRVTREHCDCNFPVGLHDADSMELRDIEKLLFDLRGARGVKCVYITKVWTGKRCKKEVISHIDDLNIPAFLADMDEECLYRIDLFERFG